MSTQRVVIYGGTGFIGRSLARKLSEDYHVVVFGRDTNTVGATVEFISGDFNSLEQTCDILQKDDVVIDLVTSSIPFSSMKSPISEIDHHILPHVRFMEEACKRGVKKIIYTSSGGGVYGDRPPVPVSENNATHPVSPHAIGKLAIENFLQYYGKAYKMPYMIYRLSNPYGPEQQPKEGFGIIPTLFSHIHSGKQPTLFNNGQAVRDFIYIDDLVDAMAQSFLKENEYPIYNLGSGVGTPIITIWEKIKELMNSDLDPIFAEKRTIDAEAIVLDTTRFSQEFGWSPKVGIEEGLEYCCKAMAQR